MRLTTTTIIMLTTLAGGPAMAAAQARERAPSANPPAATSDAATLAAGWTALAAGRRDEAVKGAQTILQRRRWDRAALTLEITALSAMTPLRGLDAYEQAFIPKRTDDVAVLEPVVIATLQEIAAMSDPALQRSALSALAAARVLGAPEKLAALAGPDSAVERDADAARSAELAGSSDRRLRLSAAKALGALKSDQSRARLQELSKDPDPLVRLWATVSLARHGDDQALKEVEQMLSSPAPDVQLAAAEAWEGRPGPWVSVVRPLLENPDGLIRLDAARVIAPVDPESARRVLNEALGDANPVVRLESAKTLDAVSDSQPAVLDVPALRQRLRDRDAHVRLSVAGTLLKVARS